MVTWNMTRRHVRILLVGDPGAGKTSLILSLVSEEFPDDVPPKAEEITIPADVTPEQVPTNIVDFCASEQTDDNLQDEINKAHVVCIVYSVENDESIDRITTHWLPFIRDSTNVDQRKPVVLVGNKIDLVDYSTIDHVLTIMEEFPEVESCVECSAKTLHNISEMFYYAQKAVLHPTAPLYIMEEQDLTDSCKKALVRIFKVCDIDGDGLLNDFELNHFQRRCFNAPLQPQVLDEVKAVLTKNVPDGIYDQSVTLKGFLFLHCLFIQRGRNETTWAVLRKFGYNESLEMCHEYLQPHIKIPPGSSTELSHRGQQFLTALFERSDRDGDGALSVDEYKAIFNACPALPWPSISDIRRTVPTNPASEKGFLSLHGWMCRWTLMTLIDLPKTLEYLAYLGFNVHENEQQTLAIHVTRERRLDLAKKQSSRSVYMCHVFGPKGCGKTGLCRGFIADNLVKLTEKEFLSGDHYCINTVQIYGQEKYLVLKDIEMRQILDPLQPNEVHCDVACLTYDVNNPTSFEYVARIYIKYFAESKIPVLITGTKGDLEEVRQDYLLQPKEFCQKYQLLPPQIFSLKDNKKDLYVKLATMAAFPHLRHFGNMATDPFIWWKAGLGVAAASIVGYFIIKVLHSTISTR